MSLIDSLWLAERRQLAAEIEDASAVTLSAAEGENALAVLDQVLRDSAPRPTVRIDFTRAGQSTAVQAALIRQTVGLLIGDPGILDLTGSQRTPEQTRLLLAARRLLGEAFAVLEGGEVEGAVGSALDAFAQHARDEGRRGALLLIGPERALVDADLRQLMWSIRSAAERLPDLVVVFCGGPGVAELTSDKKAAFYGWGSEIALGFADDSALHDAVFSRLSPFFPARAGTRAAALIVGRAHGSVSTADQLTDIVIRTALEQAPSDVADAWELLASQQAPRMRVLAAAVSSLHSLALPIATAIARGGRPYSLSESYSSKVARGIIALRAAGVIDRSGPRQWRLVDPLFADWLTRQ